MLREKRPRRWRGLLFSLLLFVFLDFTVGTLIFRFAPYRPRQAYGERGLERATHSMDLLRDVVRKHGIRLTVVVYPWPNQIAARDRDSRQVRYWRTWTAANGVEFFDSADPAVSIQRFSIEGDFHFNAAGHQRVAAAMLQHYPWVAGHSEIR